MEGSLNSRLESNKEEEEKGSGDTVPCRTTGVTLPYRGTSLIRNAHPPMATIGP